MPGNISFMKQCFPGKPWFTEKDVPDLTGKVSVPGASLYITLGSQANIPRSLL